MKKIVLLIIGVIYTLSSVAQITRQEELFTEVPIINNKVSFVKEVKLKNTAGAYAILKEWGLVKYGKDPFISSVRYDSRKNEIVAKSRIELILPKNAKGVREKMTMRFRVDGFVFEDKCILEISEMSYLHDNSQDVKLPRVIRAEDFITDEAIKKEDILQELRVNTRKSTLYFLNTLAKDFEEQYGY